MCQTTIISRDIVSIGTKSYRHRMEAVGGICHIQELERLNNDLDNFYELLWSQFNSISVDDYLIFGQQLHIMLQTIKELYSSCRKMPLSETMVAETDRLSKNYSAILELDNDIRSFRISRKDPELTNLLSRASKALASVKE